ncbi:DUF4158 domain-containing protein [Actinomadura sp. 21ATH]|uniref:DUF4158 domain-containing protein n=1 Tax=Actinomadura sp. 21ATH TaxID=1735444 RepID=UPI0035BF3B9F
MGRLVVGISELVEHWTVLDDELELVAGKRGPTRLGFALLLKHSTRYGRFLRGRAELVDEVVGYVARQVGMPASELRLYAWAGRTIEYHRAQICDHLGFWVCGVVDAEKVTQWLAAEIAVAERHPAPPAARPPGPRTARRCSGCTCAPTAKSAWTGVSLVDRPQTLTAAGLRGGSRKLEVNTSAAAGCC